MSLQGGLFQQGDAQADLAGAGHDGDDGMGGQVGRVVVERLVEGMDLTACQKTPGVSQTPGIWVSLGDQGCAWAKTRMNSTRYCAATSGL